MAWVVPVTCVVVCLSMFIARYMGQEADKVRRRWLVLVFIHVDAAAAALLLFLLLLLLLLLPRCNFHPSPAFTGAWRCQ